MNEWLIHPGVIFKKNGLTNGTFTLKLQKAVWNVVTYRPSAILKVRLLVICLYCRLVRLGPRVFSSYSNIVIQAIHAKTWKIIRTKCKLIRTARRRDQGRQLNIAQIYSISSKYHFVCEFSITDLRKDDRTVRMINCNFQYFVRHGLTFSEMNCVVHFLKVTARPDEAWILRGMNYTVHSVRRIHASSGRAVTF